MSASSSIHCVRILSAMGEADGGEDEVESDVTDGRVREGANMVQNATKIRAKQNYRTQRQEEEGEKERKRPDARTKGEWFSPARGV